MPTRPGGKPPKRTGKPAAKKTGKPTAKKTGKPKASMKQADSAGYKQLIINMMDGANKGGNAAGLKFTALLVIIAFAVGSGLYSGLGAFGTASATTTNNTNATATYGNNTYSGNVQTNTTSGNGSGSDVSAAIKAFIIGAGGVAVGLILMVLVLNFYSKAGMPESIVAASVYAFPLAIVSILAAILVLLLKIIPAIGSLLMPVLGILGAIAGVSAVIFLYVATKALLKQQARKCYYASLIGLVGFAVGVGVGTIVLGIVAGMIL